MTRFYPKVKLLLFLLFAVCIDLQAITINNVEYVIYKDTAYIVQSPKAKNEINIPSEISFSNVKCPVSYISEYAFRNCTELKRITLPSSIKAIGKAAFANSGIISVTLPDQITTIEDSLFFGCPLEQITLPSSVNRIGKAAFGFSDISAINLPEGITDIDEMAFQYCRNLYSVIIPENITEIKPGLFYKSGIENIQFHNNLRKIQRSAFNGTRIRTLILPESIKEIDHSAFYLCGLLESVVINASLSKIDTAVFASCVNLKHIEMPDCIKSIEYKAFQDCRSLVNIQLPASLEYLGEYAFNSCLALESVTLPDQLKTWGLSSFDRCPNLKDFIINPSNEYLSVLNGVVYNKEQSLLIRYPETKKETAFTVPTTVRKIDNGAFSGNAYLSQVTLPSNLEAIGKYAFNRCGNIQKIDFPSSLRKIEEYAFSGCNLSELKLNEGITHIGNFAFAGTFTYAHIPASVTHLSSSAFGSSQLNEISVHSQNSHYKSVNKILYDYSMSTILKYPSALAGEYFLIPGSVSKITPNAFSSAINLKQIIAQKGSSISSIGDRAFMGCRNLEKLDIQLSTDSLGYGIFAFCEKLKEFPDLSNLKYLGDFAFSSCKSLKEFSFPETLVSTGVQILEQCDSLETITFPSQPIKFGANILYNTENIKHIYSYAHDPYFIHFGSTLNYSDITLYVPTGSKYKYQSTEPWSMFGNIIEDISLEEESILNAETQIYASGKNIIIRNGVINHPVSVYNLQGRLVVFKNIQNSQDEIDNLQPGIYIIIHNSASHKLIIR